MQFDLLIRGGILIDGEGAPVRRTGVALTGERPGRLLRYVS